MISSLSAWPGSWKSTGWRNRRLEAIARSARSVLKWISATIGTGTRLIISGNASAAVLSGTATRTIVAPSRASFRICAPVFLTSVVSVVVIDCTATSALPPIWTPPTVTGRVFLRFIILYYNNPPILLYTVYALCQGNIGNFIGFLSLWLDKRVFIHIMV